MTERRIGSWKHGGPDAARGGAWLLRPWLALSLALCLVAGCTGAPSPTALVLATPSPAAPATTPSPSPTATLTPAPFATSARPSATPSPMRTGTPTSTSTHTPSPSPTLTATTSPTLAPPPTPAGHLAPTETLTPGITPSLTPTPRYSPTPVPTAVASGQWINILLIGLDSTANLGSQNTDVIIVAAVNPSTKQVSMLSIPRDLWVYIPGHGWNRINTAHKIGHRTKYPGGGPGLLSETIEQNLGIAIDHWARVDFQGFERVVDELGGVELTVACPVNLEYQPGQSGGEQILQPGVYHMDGATALRYVRTRRGGSDFDRARRQQQFLKAMWDQRKEIGLTEIPGLFAALSRSIKTDLGLGDVLRLAPVALSLQPQRIRSRFIGADQTQDWTTADGWRVLLPRHDRIQQVIAGLYAPPGGSDEQASAEGARIRVLNGTPDPSLGRLASEELRWHGLQIVEIGAADRTDYAQTRIWVYADKPAALKLLTQVLEVKAQNIVRQPDPNQPVDIQVILGQDYDPCR